MIKTILKLAASLAATVGAYRIMIATGLKHFKAAEFGLSLPFLAVGLLYRLDNFREFLGLPVVISSAEGAGIRFGNGKGQHYLGRAIDVIISPGAYFDINLAIAAAKKAGFSGIGIYPNSGGIAGRWRMHLDIRADRTAEDPATWSALPTEDGSGRLYAALDEGLRLYA